MSKLMDKLAAIKPQGNGDFAYEIYSSVLSDSNNNFYCSDLIEGLKVIADKEQEILNSGEYNHDANLLGLYVINNKEFWIDDLAYELRNVKTNKKILPDTWGPGYCIIA